MPVSHDKQGVMWRSVMVAVVLALAAIPTAFAESPAHAQVRGVWRRTELLARNASPSQVSAVRALATSSRRRRSANPPVQGPCSPAVIANIVQVGDLTVDSQFIYFIDGEDVIARVGKSGGTPTVLAEVPGSLAISMAMDDARIYFSTWDDASFTGSIYSVGKDGGPLVTLVRGLATPFQIAVNGQYLYWVAVGTSTGEDFLADGSIGRAAKADGSGSVQLASNLSLPLALAVDSTNVYFGETGTALGNTSAGLRRVPVAGGAVTRLLEGVIVGPVTIDSSSVYYGSLTSAGTLNIGKLSKSGGSPQTLVAGLDDVSSLLVFGSTLYYVNASDATTINAISVTGGASRIVRTGSLATATIVVEDCLLYFASDENATLERIPR